MPFHQTLQHGHSLVASRGDLLLSDKICASLIFVKPQDSVSSKC